MVAGVGMSPRNPGDIHGCISVVRAQQRETTDGQNGLVRPQAGDNPAQENLSNYPHP